jgi:hypothetical protein
MGEKVEIYQGRNVEAVKQASVVLLWYVPWMYARNVHSLTDGTAVNLSSHMPSSRKKA